MVGDPELALKYRHVDIDTASQVDVRPGSEGKFRVKFKEELLPLRDRSGGMRSLFSHNVRARRVRVFAPTSSIKNIINTFPALQPGRDGRSDKSNWSIMWRSKRCWRIWVSFTSDMACRPRRTWPPGAASPTTSRSSASLPFNVASTGQRAAQEGASQHSEKFFKRFQKIASDWMEPGVTKTSLVYSMGKTRDHQP